MIKKDMHLVRKTFRGALLVALGMAIAFFAMVVGLRVEYRDQGIYGVMQTKIFEFDVLQHRAAAYFANDSDDMILAENLLRLGLFSTIYSDAGITMLRDKAADGYAPAAFRLEQLDIALEAPVQAMENGLKP